MANDITCPYSSKSNSSFPAREYLKRFTDPTTDPMQVHVKFLRAYHDFYEKYSGTFSKPCHLLEFGGGPCLHSLISASRHVDSVTFADYAESNRNEIISWRAESDDCHEWSPYFKFVITELEKNKDDISAERQTILRQKLQEVVMCNIRDDSILGEREVTSFDIIQTNLCLEIASETRDEFAKSLVGLGKMLKPGGYVVCLTAKGGSWYTCAGSGCKWHQLKMEETDILWAFDKAGM